jgi:hypothetical protein
MFGIQGSQGMASLGVSGRVVEDKNVFAFPPIFSSIMGGRYADRLSLTSLKLYAVGIDAVGERVVEIRDVIDGGQGPDCPGPLITQAYNLSTFSPLVSQVLLILNCSGLRLAKDVTFKLESSEKETIFDQVFNVREAGDSQALVLAVLERTDGRWIAGPVGALATRYSPVWADRLLPQLAEYWKVGLPNPLAGDWQKVLFTKDVVAHLVAHVPDGELPAIYQHALTQLGQNFTADFATDLLCRLVYQWSGTALTPNRISIANSLVDCGAEWREIFFSADLDDDQSIAALCRLGQMQPSWAGLFLSTYSPARILEYASTEEKADAVYKLAPHNYLLGRISERSRVQALESDLGL